MGKHSQRGRHDQPTSQAPSHYKLSSLRSTQLDWKRRKELKAWPELGRHGVQCRNGNAGAAAWN
eukprot:15481646-Alexandrium_andersonii.AAC.1